MGMFDYVRCEYPLPDGFVPSEKYVFQSKTFEDPMMDTYTITADGRLLHALRHMEDSGETYPEDHNLSFMRGMPIMRMVDDGTVEVAYHGDLEIHEWEEESQLMRQYVVRFTNGRVQEVRGGLGAARTFADIQA